MTDFTRRGAIASLVASCMSPSAFADCEELLDGVQYCSSSNLNGLPLGRQRVFNTCWAATISNLFAHHSKRVREETIVTALFGRAVDQRGGYYCNMSSLMNRTWID